MHCKRFRGKNSYSFSNSETSEFFISMKMDNTKVKYLSAIEFFKGIFKNIFKTYFRDFMF